MRELIGLEIDNAKALLDADDIDYYIEECVSDKMTVYDRLIVIQATKVGDKVKLVVSRFKVGMDCE